MIRARDNVFRFTEVCKLAKGGACLRFITGYLYTRQGIFTNLKYEKLFLQNVSEKLDNKELIWIIDRNKNAILEGSARLKWTLHFITFGGIHGKEEEQRKKRRKMF